MSEPTNERLIADLRTAHRDQIGFLDALAAVDDRLAELDRKIEYWQDVARDTVERRFPASIEQAFATYNAVWDETKWSDEIRRLYHNDPGFHAAIHILRSAKPKAVCQTCGDTGTIPASSNWAESTGQAEKPCPACGGKS